MKTLTLYTLMAMLCGAGSVRTAWAQTEPRHDVSLSYAVLTDLDLERTFPVGWVASASTRVFDRLAIVGEVGGSYDTLHVPATSIDLTVYNFMAGVRFAGHEIGKVHGFGQVLVGAARLSAGVLGASGSDTSFAIQPGGGVDVSLDPNIAIRIQGDYRATIGDGTNNAIRIAAGVVLGFGR